MKKRILAVTLAAVMITALIPLTASAATVHNVSSSAQLAAVVDDFTDGDIINITASFTHNDEIGWSDMSAELRLNGNTLTVENTSEGDSISLYNATLTVVGPGTLNAICTDGMSVGIRVLLKSSLINNGAVINAVNTEDDRAVFFAGDKDSIVTVTTVSGRAMEDGEGTLIITGNVVGAVSSLAGKVTVHGNVQGHVGAMYRGTITVNGNVSGGASAVNIYDTEPNRECTVIINGILTSPGSYIRFSYLVEYDNDLDNKIETRTPEQYDNTITRDGATYRQYVAPSGYVLVRVPAGDPRLAGAAQWAIDQGLGKALDAELIPDSFIGNWTQHTNRLIAAEAIVKLIEAAYGKSYTAIAEEKGFDMTNRFADTNNVYATFLKASGISTGLDNINYGITGSFSRIQMVTMLGRAAEKVFDVDMSVYPPGSATFDDLPGWARNDPYVGWAATTGVTLGEGNRLFNANGILPNQQTGIFLYRALNEFNK